MVGDAYGIAKSQRNPVSIDFLNQITTCLVNVKHVIFIQEKTKKQKI